MTQPKTRFHRYSDHRGRVISVRATQNDSGEWVEMWTTEQIMAVDLSNEDDEDDTSPQPTVVYQSASDSSRGSKPPTGSPKHGRATKNTNYRKRA